MKHFFPIILLSLVGGVFLTACSEKDDTVEEFANWQQKNEAFVKTLYTQTKEKVAAGDKEWKVIRSWSMPEDNPEFLYTEKPEDCIVVRVLEEGEGEKTPLYTDRVRVHYQGRLLPSASYATGYVFDQSYYGQFNAETAVPSQFAVNGVVDGFATALLNMHIGDRWEVYIPYQLGYGEKKQNSIPGYSTLVFTIQMVDFFHPDQTPPVIQ